MPTPSTDRTSSTSSTPRAEIRSEAPHDALSDALSGSRTAAFFDLDKTIIPQSSAFAAVRVLVRAGHIRKRDALRLAASELSYVIRGADAAAMDRAKNQFTALLAGQHADILHSAAEHIVRHTVLPRIYDEAAGLITWHKQHGHTVAIISASAEELVQPIAAALGIDHAIASQLETDGTGAYTGRVSFYCKADAKATAITEFARQHHVDLADSYAYSDSYTDVPLLAAVGHPRAVNPDKELEAYAQARGWHIARFTPRGLHAIPAALHNAYRCGADWARRAASSLPRHHASQ